MTSNHQWYRIENKVDKRRAEILIYEQIGKTIWDDSGVGAKDFVLELKALDVDDIDLSINSPGGSVFEGNTIYNALKAHRAKIHVRVDGIAASIASVIAMAGDTIEMPENAMMMVHDPWGWAMGTADEMRKQAEALDKIKTGIITAYRRSGQDDERLAELMTAETWMTANEAVELGFADTVLAPVEAQASFEMLKTFRNTPASLSNAGITGTTPMVKNMANTPHAPVITLDLIRAEYREIADALVNEGKDVGIKAERERVAGIQSCMLPGHEDLIASMLADGTSVHDASLKIIAAEKSAKAQHMASFQGEAPPPAQQPAADAPGNHAPKNDAPVEDRAKAEWDASASIRREFFEFENYLAFKKADEAGALKVLKGKE